MKSILLYSYNHSTAKEHSVHLTVSVHIGINVVVLCDCGFSHACKTFINKVSSLNVIAGAGAGAARLEYRSF